MWSKLLFKLRFFESESRILHVIGDDKESLKRECFSFLLHRFCLRYKLHFQAKIPSLFSKVKDEFQCLYDSTKDTFLADEWRYVLDYVQTTRNHSQIAKTLNDLKLAGEMFAVFLQMLSFYFKATLLYFLISIWIYTLLYWALYSLSCSASKHFEAIRALPIPQIERFGTASGQCIVTDWNCKDRMHYCTVCYY